MKKILAFFLLLAAMAALAGCGREEVPFTEKNYNSGEETITHITVDVRDREIRVELSEDETVSIAYFESEKEGYAITVADGRLIMAAADNKEWKDYVGTNGAKEDRVITLRLPQEMLEGLTLSTTNENITLPQLTVADTVSLTANGGDIIFDTLNVGSSLDLNVKNGDIAGKLLGGWDDFAISCTIKKGDTDLPETKDGGDKTLTVNANNGDVNIEFVK